MDVKFIWNNDVRRKFRHLSTEAQKVLDSEVLKSSNKRLPKDTGNLETSSITSTRLGSGRIIWDTVYARRLYYNPQYNFSKDKNPLAQGLWFQVAKASDLKKWLQEIKRRTKQIF